MSVTAIQSLVQFHEIINGSTPVAIDFWATWCGPCRIISPIFETLATKFPAVLCYKVDVDEQTEISREVSIRAMPTFQIYKGGKKVGELVGANPGALENLLATHSA